MILQGVNPKRLDPTSGTPTPKYILHMTYTIFIKVLFKAQTMLVTK